MKARKTFNIFQYSVRRKGKKGRKKRKRETKEKKGRKNEIEKRLKSGSFYVLLEAHGFLKGKTSWCLISIRLWSRKEPRVHGNCNIQYRGGLWATSLKDFWECILLKCCWFRDFNILGYH